MSERDLAKAEFASALQRMRQLPEQGRSRVQSQFAQALLEERFIVETPRGPLAFVLVGPKSMQRARNVLSKQPGTISWIDSFTPDSVFWDIGANVGVYALYAALRNDTTVVAFEPAAVNYFLLAANCESNHLDARMTCLLAGLGTGKAIGRLAVSQFAAAESCAFRGKDLSHATRQAALLVSMDELVEEFGLHPPNYVKIDVPGLTEDILIGGTRTLARTEVRELHIEMREHSKTGVRIVPMLRELGFTLTDRHTHAAATDVTFVRTTSSQ